MRRLTKKVISGPASCLRLRVLMWGMIGGLVLFPCRMATAQCASSLTDGDFEEQSRERVGIPWYVEGKAGTYRRHGLSYRGDNNAWARSNTEWNGIFHYPILLTAGVNYTLKAFVQTSENVRDGYFGFRSQDRRPVSEIKFGSLPAYKELKVQFRPARTGRYPVFIGFWAPNQDAWIHVDHVRLESPCHDVQANPADQ